jgi:hypothetical protein
MELNDKQQDLYRLLKAIALTNRRSLTPEELDDHAGKYGKLNGLSDAEIAEVSKEYKQREGVSMPHVSMLEKEDNDKWFEAIQDKKELFVHWNRYHDFLGTQKGFSDDTLGSMEDDIKRTVSHFANPQSLGKVAKKGLVVGDVQSGKTANYIGLINMAVDVGYRTIVLLAGLTEDLRIQTQGRVDEGFIGAKSETFKDGEPETFGVSMDGNHYGVTFTSKDHDFVTSTAASISARINDYKKPVVSVIKKNKKVIDTLNQFMSDNTDRQESPLLIIDDECDNASINTKDPDSPTSINEKIRELFSLYRIVTYVGYSATPFANIFVDPDANYKVEENSDDEKPMAVAPGTELPDLFPDDFIVLLEPPTNYMGALRLFKGFNKEKTKGFGTDHIVEIGKTGDNIFPARHKVTDFFTELAPSLKDAIDVFLLSSVVYSIRGHDKKHRSMLINISRFNETQAEIAHIVGDYVAQLKSVIQAYSFLPLKEFLQKPELKHLYDVWMDDKYFGKSDTYGVPTNKNYDFDSIRTKLYSEICLFEVVVVNGTIKKKDRFKYELRKDVGARVIVIGGFSLSRGLTLEGLMTSYYNRNATAFDVLLQMGRWFGYRPDYEDLINIFMTQSSIDAFCAVSESTEDLKEQFRRMAETKKTPREFGLMVREAPDTLDNTILITSRNKMRNSEDYVREISLSGSTIDTSKINVSLYSNIHNKKETEVFFKSLQSAGVVYKESLLMKGHFYFSGVPAIQIASFLAKLDISYANNSFDQQALIPFIKNTPALRMWDVVVATGGSGITENIAGNVYPMPSRSFLYDQGDKYLRVGGTNNRLLDPGIFKVDISREQLEVAKASAERRRQYKIEQHKMVDLTKDEDLIARDLLDIEKRLPLLVIFPLNLNTEPKDGENKKALYQEIKDQLQGVPAYGFGIGFPGSFKNIKTIYRINLVKKNAIMNGEVEDNEDENDSDEEGNDDE